MRVCSNCVNKWAVVNVATSCSVMIVAALEAAAIVTGADLEGVETAIKADEEIGMVAAIQGATGLNAMTVPAAATGQTALIVLKK